MDSSISIPLDLSSVRPLSPSLPLPLVERKPEADVAAPPVAPAKMQPHLGYAFLLSLGLFTVLTGVNVAWSIVAVVVTLAHGEAITPEALMQYGSANVGVILLTLFASSAIYCVGTAAIAFRGQMVERLSIRKITRLQLVAVVAMALPLAVVISSLAASIIGLLGIESLPSGDIVTEPPTLLLALFSIAVLPAVGEEIFFRGLLSRGLIARHGLILGIIFATALFALVHANPIQIFVIFFMGLVMQATFMWTRSILSSILLHGLYNGTIVVFARNAPAELSQVAEAAALPSIAVSLIAVIALLVVLYQSRTRWQLPDGSFWSPGYVATDMPPREVGAVAVNAKARLAPMLSAGLSFAVLIVLTVMSIAL